MRAPSAPPRIQTAQVYGADAMRVIAGANLGDMLESADGLCLGDLYRLRRAAQMGWLRVVAQDGGAAQVAEDSAQGVPGDAVSAQARLRFMSASGADAAGLLVALGVPEMGGTLCLLPLHGLTPGQDYTLIGIDTPGTGGAQPLPRSDLNALGLARGTRIAAADGKLVPVEQLRPGDRLLTRDNGARPLLSVHSRTVPALGAETPVVIAPGRLGNPQALMLAPQHRLFFYQHGQDRLTETSEILVQAAALTGTGDIARRKGGYVEYFVLVLDAHEILYVEGVPTESLEWSATARAHLPDGLAQDVETESPGLRHAPHFAEEADTDTAAAMVRTLLGR